MGEKTKKKGSISYAKWGYIFIAPFFLIFALFQLIPLGSTIYYSFFEYYRSGLKVIGPNFAGLKNYITLFATDLPAAEPRPGPTMIPFDFAKWIKSHTIRK